MGDARMNGKILGNTNFVFDPFVPYLCTQL
jgi:hypothetical protein